MKNLMAAVLKGDKRIIRYRRDGLGLHDHIDFM